MMATMRVDHGLCRLGDYLYALGGRGSNSILFELDCCERLNLQTLRWSQDVPDLRIECSCMTVIQANHTWLYAFCSKDKDPKNPDAPFGLFLQRLNTLKLNNKTLYHNVEWDLVPINPNLNGIYYPAVIKLQSQSPEHRRYLIVYRKYEENHDDS